MRKKIHSPVKFTNWIMLYAYIIFFYLNLSNLKTIIGLRTMMQLALLQTHLFNVAKFMEFKLMILNMLKLKAKSQKTGQML